MSTIYDGVVNETNGVHLTLPAVEGPAVTILAEAVLLNSAANDGNGNEGHALWLSGGAYTVTNSGVVFTSSLFGEVAAGIFVDSDADGTKITNKAEGSISGYAYGIDMDGNTTLTNAGLVSGFIAVNGNAFNGDGAYTVTNSGIIATFNSAGWDTNNYNALAVRLSGSGKQNLTNTASGQIFGDIALSGIATLKNDGHIEGEVQLSGAGGAVLTFANKGEVFAFDTDPVLRFDFGSKQVATNSATGRLFGDVVFANADGGSANSFKNDGLVEGDIDFDSLGGTITFSNKGSVEGSITSDSNAVVINNSGTITGSITLAEGADTIKNTGHIVLGINLGGGNDTFFGGSKFADAVSDAEGQDFYKFGSKDDVFDAVGTGSATGQDTVDGGANGKVLAGLAGWGDVYNAQDAGNTTNLRINLDTVQQTSLIFGITFGTVLAAGTATDDGTGVDFGTDLIKNFEAAWGGDGSDIIMGNASANTIWGGDNADELWGGKGNDSLSGNFGGDFLVGGLGRDQLRGGEGGGDALTTDFFVYNSTAESTVALSGRDMIMDFTNDDIIDLTAFGMAGFNMIGNAASFQGGDGDAEGKVLQTNVGWTFLLDSNDDGKVDFAIDFFDEAHANQLLAGSIDWTP